MKKITKITILLIVMFFLSSCGKKSYVFFDYNCNGQELHKCELKNNKLSCFIQQPTCGEYKFKGWYRANEYKTPIDVNESFNKNEIIYARWEENGQVIESSSQELVSTIITPTPIDQPSSSQIEYSSQEEPSSQKPTPEATYTITFNLNGGSGGQSSQISGVKYGSNLPSISSTKPTKSGYTFLGWYDSQTGGTQYYNSSNSPVKKYDKKSNITLYAQWRINVLTIQYNGNGGTWISTNSNYGVNSSGTVIVKSTGQVFSQKVNYGTNTESSGLTDYNGSWFKWKKDGHIVESKKEYFLQNGSIKNTLDQTKVYSAADLARYSGCDLSKNDCTITVKVNWKKPTLSITKIEHNAALVTVYATSDKTIAGYYFTTSSTKPKGNEDTWVLKNTNKLEIAKLPGTYYVYVKDVSNNISESVKLTLTISDIYSSTLKSRTGTNYIIKEQLSSVEKSQYDDFIAWSVRSAGLFTKEAVVTAGLAGITWMQQNKNGLGIPYVSNHKCFGQRYNVYFGSNPDWGKKIKLSGSDLQEANENGGIAKFCKGEYGGLDCQAFVGWSIHNGGFKAENTFGSYSGAKIVKKCQRYALKEDGTTNNVKCEVYSSNSELEEMYELAEPGDILVNNGHVMLVFLNDKTNREIYITEGTTPVGMNKYSYKQLSTSLKVWALTRMENYYKGNHACLKTKNGSDISLPPAYSSRKSEFRTNCFANN